MSQGSNHTRKNTERSYILFKNIALLITYKQHLEIKNLYKELKLKRLKTHE